MDNLVYFSAADRHMESFLEADAFDRSLLLNVLFQLGLLAPGILLAISGHLAIHLQNPKITLVEACIEEGLLVPSFRGNATSFTEAYKLICDQNIIGVQPSAKRSMERLQRAADRNKNFRWAGPAVHLGVTFDERLQILQKAEAPYIGPSFAKANQQQELQKYWLLTERWRRHCIDEARKATQKAGELGIRRGEIVKAVARDLSGGRVAEVEDVAALFEALPDRTELQVFFQWICEIYGYNQALGMGGIPNFPAYNPLSEVSLKAEAATLVSGSHTKVFETISETVEFPPVSVLRNKSPIDLLAIRRDNGAQYLADLDSWLADPKNATLEASVRQSLKGYAAQIVAASRNPYKSLLTVTLSHLPPGLEWPVMAGAGAAAVAASSPAHAILGASAIALCAVAEGVYALYQFYDGQRLPKKQALTLSSSRQSMRCEMNVDKHHKVREPTIQPKP